MADTVSNVRRRIRLLIDDMDNNAFAIDSERLTTLMENRMQFTAADVGMGPAWVSGAVTLTASSFEYTLPTSIQYQRVMAVQLNSQEWLMERVTPLELKALQDGAGSEDAHPTHYSLFEDASQQIHVWLFPTPSAADTLNILRAQVPAALTTDAINIPFSDPLLRAFEKACALEALLLMDEEERARRKAVLDGASKWEREINRAHRLERVRMGNLKRSDRVPLKWV